MKKLLYILTVLILSIACKKDKQENNSNGNNQAQIVQLDSFPLTVGHSWKYFTEMHLADSNGVVFESKYYDNYWVIISDTTINGIASAKISQLDSNYNQTTHLAYSYYANKPNGFFGMAVENSGSMFFLRQSSQRNQLQFNLFSNFGNNTLGIDTVFVPDSSLYLMKFPSTINDTWVSYEYGTPGLIKRKWIGYSTISTNAGTFNCIKLQAFWDRDGDNQPDSSSITIYQYFSDKGLIEETQFAHLTFSSGATAILNQTTKLVQVNF